MGKLDGYQENGQEMFNDFRRVLEDAVNEIYFDYDPYLLLILHDNVTETEKVFYLEDFFDDDEERKEVLRGLVDDMMEFVRQSFADCDSDKDLYDRFSFTKTDYFDLFKELPDYETMFRDKEMVVLSVYNINLQLYCDHIVFDVLDFETKAGFYFAIITEIKALEGMGHDVVLSLYNEDQNKMGVQRIIDEEFAGITDDDLTDFTNHDVGVSKAFVNGDIGKLPKMSEFDDGSGDSRIDDELINYLSGQFGDNN